MAEDVLETRLLDRHMKEVFGWNGSNTSVRDAIRDYFIGRDGKNTLKIEKGMPPFLEDSGNKVEAFVNENLRG